MFGPNSNPTLKKKKTYKGMPYISKNQSYVSYFVVKIISLTIEKEKEKIKKLNPQSLLLSEEQFRKLEQIFPTSN